MGLTKRGLGYLCLQKIRSFDYEDDSQIEALLLSLSAIFSTDKQSLASNSKRRIEARDDNKVI